MRSTRSPSRAVSFFPSARPVPGTRSAPRGSARRRAGRGPRSPARSQSQARERKRAEEIGAHRLVAGHHVRDPAVVDHVRGERDGLVTEHVPEAERRLGRPGAGAEDDVRVAVEERLEDGRKVGRRGTRGRRRGWLRTRRLRGQVQCAPPHPSRGCAREARSRPHLATHGAMSSSRVPSVDPSSTIDELAASRPGARP